MVILPFTGFPKESMEVTLEGRALGVKVQFSNLLETWSMDMIDLDGDVPVTLIEGIVMMIGADIFAPYALELGGLFLEPTTDRRVDPKRDELGVRVRMVHYTPTELAAK